MSLTQNAFNLVFKIQAQIFTLRDSSTNNTYTIKAAPSNYFRDFAFVEEISIKGREYVLSKSNLELAGFTGAIQKNDRLINPDDSYDYRTIIEVREMVVMGVTVGYRVRTN